MAASVRLIDEHFGSSAPVRRPACELRLASERASPRDIIRRRVETEVEDLNQANIARFEGHARTRSFLVEIDANSVEARLNGPVPGKRKPKLYDVEREVQRAVAAFQQGTYIMLFDDSQVDDLDYIVTLTPDSEVSFVYLTPLKGG